jgi:phospholipase/carboxylesterase
MTLIPSPLHDLFRTPREGTTPDSAVILLHGLGADSHDLIGLADVWADLLPRTAFLSPDAPFACDMAPFGRQWFSMQVWSLEGFFDGVREATVPLTAYLENVQHRLSLPLERIALVGFSQGCIMALHVGLRLPRPLAGIVGYSGLLLGSETLAQELRSRPPVFLAHGDMDPVVPVTGSYGAEEILQANSVSVTLHISPNAPHTIAPDGLKLGGEMLQKWFGPNAVKS